MIFVTVGAQMPFDRLIRAVDEWADSRNRRDVFAQIGQTDYQPRSIEWVSMLPPREFQQRTQSADFLVAHAGMGSIISALEIGKPILVMPRREALRETRNDHQVATAERFLAQGRVAVAFDEHELPDRLDALLSASEPRNVPQRIGHCADESLIRALRQFIFDGDAPGQTRQEIP